MSWCSTFLKLIYELLKLLVSIALSVFLVLPVVILVFGTNEIVRLTLSIYLWSKFVGRVRLVKDGKDGIFCHLRSVYLRTLLEYDLPFDVDKFEKLVKSNIVKDGVTSGSKDAYEWKMRQIITKHSGYFCWTEDDNFRWSNHCRSLAADKCVTRKQLMTIIDGLSHDLGELQPQWEVIYIPNIENKRFGILLNFHHGYSDGLSLMTMIAERISPVKPFPYVVNPRINSVSWQTRVVFNVKAYLYLGWSVLKEVVQYYPKKKKSKDLMKCSQRDEGIPEHCHLAKIEMSSATIKSIRNIANVPVPAILLAIYARSLEKVLRARGDDKIPEGIPCGYTVAKFPYHESLSNRMILIETHAPLGKKMEEREDMISSLEETSTTLSMSFDDCYITHDFSLFGRLPCGLIKLPRVSPGWFLQSNIPFAKQKVKIGGGIPVAVSAWPTLMRGYPYQLLASNISYGDTISACLIAKSSAFLPEEMDTLVEEIPKQLKALERLICQQATMSDQEFDHLPTRTSHLCLHNAK